MTKKTTYNLIIVDDHKMFLDGLESIFSVESSYHIVNTFNDGLQAKKYLQTHLEAKVDLAILDINMPKIDGLALNDYIKKKHPTIKTLIVSMLSDPESIYKLTQNSVDGYLPKNAKKTELLLAVETILTGNTYFSESIKKIYSDSVFNRGKTTAALLTPRETQILQLIAQEYTTTEIAKKLFLSKYTIEGYRASLISKLQVRNVAGLVKYAVKIGLVE